MGQDYLSAKTQAIEMYLNNVGIRKIAKFVGCSPHSVIYWIQTLGKKIEAQLQNDDTNHANDVPPRSFTIEMDEIYTFVQTKKQRIPIWTAYCRETGGLVAYVIGERGRLSSDTNRLKADALLLVISTPMPIAAMPQPLLSTKYKSSLLQPKQRRT